MLNTTFVKLFLQRKRASVNLDSSLLPKICDARLRMLLVEHAPIFCSRDLFVFVMRMHIPSFIFLETTIERINRRPVIYAFSFILSIVSRTKLYRTDTSFQHAVAGYISEDGVKKL